MFSLLSVPSFAYDPAAEFVVADYSEIRNQGDYSFVSSYSGNGFNILQYPSHTISIPAWGSNGDPVNPYTWIYKQVSSTSSQGSPLNYTCVFEVFDSFDFKEGAEYTFSYFDVFYPSGYYQPHIVLKVDNVSIAEYDVTEVSGDYVTSLGINCVQREIKYIPAVGMHNVKFSIELNVVNKPLVSPYVAHSLGTMFRLKITGYDPSLETTKNPLEDLENAINGNGETIPNNEITVEPFPSFEIPTLPVFDYYVPDNMLTFWASFIGSNFGALITSMVLFSISLGIIAFIIRRRAGGSSG